MNVYVTLYVISNPVKSYFNTADVNSVLSVFSVIKTQQVLMQLTCSFNPGDRALWSLQANGNLHSSLQPSRPLIKFILTCLQLHPAPHACKSVHYAKHGECTSTIRTRFSELHWRVCTLTTWKIYSGHVLHCFLHQTWTFDLWKDFVHFQCCNKCLSLSERKTACLYLTRENVQQGLE